MSKEDFREKESDYGWQEECLAIWEKNGKKGIVQAVTGAGKTILAIKAIKVLAQLYGKSLWTVIVVPTKALEVQWKRILRSFLLEPDSPEGLRYQIFIVNSARYRLARWILAKIREGDTVFLIADECHHYVSVENRKIFEFVPFLEEVTGNYCAMGLSATIEDKNSAELLEPALGRIIFRYTYGRALHEGVISEFTLIQIALHFQIHEAEEYEELSERMKLLRSKLYACYPLLKKEGISFFAVLQSIAQEEGTANSKLARYYLNLSYQRKRLVCMAGNRLFCVCDLLREVDIRKRVLIFSESIEQAEMLYEMLKQEYYGKAGRYHSKAGKQANENALERFRNGEILILISCKALDEGIDVPGAGIGIILSGTGMERQRIQRLGRVLRKDAQKKMACLYYLFIKESMEEKSYFPLRREYFQVEDWEYQEGVMKK